MSMIPKSAPSVYRPLRCVGPALTGRKPRKPRPFTRPRPRPAAGWPDYSPELDEERWTIEDDDYRPSIEEPGPSPEDECEATAFDLGYRHIEANPPAGTGIVAAYAWRHAHNLGWLRRESDLIVAGSRKPRVSGLSDADLYRPGAAS